MLDIKIGRASNNGTEPILKLLHVLMLKSVVPQTSLNTFRGPCH